MSQTSLLTPSAPSFPPLTYQNIPVLTTEMLAQAYEVEPHHIRQNFKNNRARFIEGKHFFLLSGNDLREFKNCVENFYSVQIGKRTASFILWTDRGCARHAKSLNTDRAWDMYELLEETFFRVVRPESDPALPADSLAEASITITPSTTASRKALEKLVKVWSVQGGIIVSQCWTMLNSAFNLQSITELPEEWIPDAIAWVQEKIDGLQKTLPRARLPVSKRCAPTPASPIDEAAILQLIKDIQEAHEQVETILDPLSTRAVRLATTLALEIQKRGALSPSIGPLFHNGLDDLLFHSTFKATRQAMIAPARLLDEYSNPGYTLLSIARQLNAKG